MSSAPCSLDRSHLGGMNFPLVKLSDMPDEMRMEARETIVTALEKFPDQYEAAAKFVKDLMDRKFGASWHCVIGEGCSQFCSTHVSHLRIRI